eukprot:70469-Amphidinium_carterae.1
MSTALLCSGCHVASGTKVTIHTDQAKGYGEATWRVNPDIDDVLHTTVCHSGPTPQFAGRRAVQ